MVMVPRYSKRVGITHCFSRARNPNVTLETQSDPSEFPVVDGYTEEQLAKLHNGMPQRAYTESKRQWKGRPQAHWKKWDDFNTDEKIPPLQKWKIVRAINIIWIHRKIPMLLILTSPKVGLM